jgi:hypothetical protein
LVNPITADFAANNAHRRMHPQSPQMEERLMILCPICGKSYPEKHRSAAVECSVNMNSKHPSLSSGVMSVKSFCG